jgi:hypothetical protein
MPGYGKRCAQVPPAAFALGECVSKATLLEVAYHFALRCTGTENEREAIRDLIAEVELLTGKRVSVPKRWQSRSADALREALATPAPERKE